MLFTATTNQPTKSVTNPSQAFGKRKLFSSAVKLILKPPLLHFVTSAFTPNLSIFNLSFMIALSNQTKEFNSSMVRI